MAVCYIYLKSVDLGFTYNHVVPVSILRVLVENLETRYSKNQEMIHTHFT